MARLPEVLRVADVVARRAVVAAEAAAAVHLPKLPVPCRGPRTAILTSAVSGTFRIRPLPESRGLMRPLVAAALAVAAAVLRAAAVLGVAAALLVEVPLAAGPQLVEATALLAAAAA